MLEVVNLCVTNPERDKFLFLRRNKHPYKEHWGMLGGKVDHGEHHVDAASRELFEESGISSKGAFIGKCHEKIIENNQVVVEVVVYVYHFVVGDDTKFRSGGEGDLRWIDINDFKNNRMITSDPLIINSFLIEGKKEALSIVKKFEEDYSQEHFFHREGEAKNG